MRKYEYKPNLNYSYISKNNNKVSIDNNVSYQNYETNISMNSGKNNAYRVFYYKLKNRILLHS